ncbi:hypothetical protein TNCV_4347161 [Trichonephila clavipes]|nr:hypothetical protein TNCV_4347161 [Trichonephila clavipes]
MLTANIEATDGLANAAVGKLSYFQLDDQKSLRVWLIFLNGFGVKAREKVAGYANAKGIGREMVPINRRSATAILNRNRLIHAKRNHFPLKPTYSLLTYLLQRIKLTQRVQSFIRLSEKYFIFKLNERQVQKGPE